MVLKKFSEGLMSEKSAMELERESKKSWGGQTPYFQVCTTNQVNNKDLERLVLNSIGENEPVPFYRVVSV
jgi:hypothetical protein